MERVAAAPAAAGFGVGGREWPAIGLRRVKDLDGEAGSVHGVEKWALPCDVPGELCCYILGFRKGGFCFGRRGPGGSAALNGDSKQRGVRFSEQSRFSLLRKNLGRGGTKRCCTRTASRLNQIMGTRGILQAAALFASGCEGDHTRSAHGEDDCYKQIEKGEGSTVLK